MLIGFHEYTKYLINIPRRSGFQVWFVFKMSRYFKSTSKFYKDEEEEEYRPKKKKYEQRSNPNINHEPKKRKRKEEEKSHKRLRKITSQEVEGQEKIEESFENNDPVGLESDIEEEFHEHLSDVDLDALEEIYEDESDIDVKKAEKTTFTSEEDSDPYDSSDIDWTMTAADLQKKKKEKAKEEEFNEKYISSSSEEEELLETLYNRSSVKELKEKGYTVIPIFKLPELDELVTKLNEEAGAWPEYPPRTKQEKQNLIHDIQKDGKKFVGGGFGALANPSSFHCDTVRDIRKLTYEKLKSFWKYYEKKTFPNKRRTFSMIIDRLMIRAKGETVSPESWHRDEAEDALDGDHIFGGWVNLNLFPQVFTCLPKSHIPIRNYKGGFNKQKFTDEETSEMTENQEVVEIPPGHIIIFYEHILHIVSKHVNKDETILRLFIGWNFSSSNEPLNYTVPELLAALKDNAPMKLKSGQIPRLWPKMYTSQPKTLESFTTKCFKIGQYKDPYPPLWTYPSALMKSLKEMGFRTYEYSEEETSMLIPHLL